eukprot:2713440-Prymnesium_polylepis.1
MNIEHTHRTPVPSFGSSRVRFGVRTSVSRASPPPRRRPGPVPRPQFFLTGSTATRARAKA